MLAYIDSSVLLRKILGEPGALSELSEIKYGISSVLLQVECLRTLDRYRIMNEDSEDHFLMRTDRVYEAMRRLELIRISPGILTRASQPFATSLGTLDAIHLSTCLAYAEWNSEREIVVCTHDESFQKAARAAGFRVLG